MDYCNRVQGFINFATSIPRNFTGGGIRCPCRKCENKKYLHPDVVTMHLLHKGFKKTSISISFSSFLFSPHLLLFSSMLGYVFFFFLLLSS
jgi:hypothetical protein